MALKFQMRAPPILDQKDPDVPSVFAPAALMREARRQKGLASVDVPSVSPRACAVLSRASRTPSADPSYTTPGATTQRTPHILTFAVNLRRRSLSRSAVTRFDQHAFSASWRQAAGPSLGSEVPAPPPGQTDDVDGCLSHKKCPKRLQFSHQMHILTIDAQ